MAKSDWNPFAAWIPYSTFHSWMVALFYPAVLGTALMAWLSPVAAGGPLRVDTQWAPVLIAYFAIQYGDGIGRKAEYRGVSLLADIGEILVILAAFDRMNVLDIGFMNHLPSLTLPWVLLIAFLIPVAGRIARWLLSRSTAADAGDIPRALIVSAMSVLAGLISFRGPESPSAAGWVTVILLIYFLFFIAPRSEKVGDLWNSLRRDPPA